MQDFAAPVAASFTVSRSISLTAAAFSSSMVGDWVFIMRSFLGFLAYDLIASPGQYVQSPGYFTIDNFNDQGIVAIKNVTGANGTTVIIPTEVVAPLDLVYSSFKANLSVVGTINPGVAVAAAAIQSIRVGFHMIMDAIPEPLWDSDYAFDILRKGR